jgi:hypothetical protein
LQDPALKHIVGVVIDGAVILRLLDPEPVDSGPPLLALQRYPDPKNPGKILVVPQDRFVRAYHYGGDVRFFLANTVTAYLGEPSQETRYSIAALPRDPYALCAYLAWDILPTVDGKPEDGLSKNPHGFLDIKGVNTVVNFDDDILYFFKPNGLNGLPDGTNYIIEEHSFFDVQLAIEEVAPYHMLPLNAHGQFMVAATENGVTHIILGYICYKTDADTGIITEYEQSVIVKLRVEAGMSPNGYPILSYVEQAWAGLNAATAAIGRDKIGILRLFLGVIGGGQQDKGATNGVASGIRILPFFGPWPQTAPNPPPHP